MRKLFSGLLLAGLFIMALFSPGAAFAYEEPQPEGQLIKEKSYIGLAYFQVWQHSDRRWQDTDRDGTPDKPGQVKSWDFKMPGSLESLTSKWNLTGVRVRFLPANQVDEWETLYNQYKGYKGLSFDTFNKQILKYSAAKGQEGRVWAEEHFPGEWTYTLHYEGIRLATQPGVGGEQLATEGAMDLKWPDNRSFVQSLGIPMSLPSGASFSQMAAGYIYWVPYIVEVYGTPKGKPKAPNFSVELDPGCPKEPVQVASSDPNAAGLLAQSERYVAEPGKTYTATVKFKVSNSVTEQDGPPFSVVVAGIHQLTGNKFYPVSLEYVSGDGKVWSQQGLGSEIPFIPEDVTVHLVTFNRGNSEVVAKFDWTAQPDTKQLVAVINYDWPESSPLPYTFTFYAEGETGDQYGDNVVIVPINVEAPDLYVKSLNPSTLETEPGEKYNGTVTFGLKNTFNKPVTAILEFTHNGYPVRDTEGQLIDGRIIILDPGEEIPVDFTFTGLNEDSHLVAKIRPVHYSVDADWSNNSKEVTIPVKKKLNKLGERDLSIRWGSRKTAMQPGEKFKFSAVVDSSYRLDGYHGRYDDWYDEGFYTYVVWRVDGKQVDLQRVWLDNWKDTITSNYTFTMPRNVKGDYVVLEAEVNPYRNSPDNESNWNNNKTEKLVVRVIKGPDDIDKDQPIWFTR